MYRGNEFDDLLKRHRPNLIVTGTPGVNPHDMHLLRAGRRLGIETATVMLSWEISRPRGTWARRRTICSWRDLMADEAMQYRQFPGAAHPLVWRPAVRQLPGHPRAIRPDGGRREHGVPEGRPLVVYGTINPALLPHEPNILKQIIATASSSSYSKRPFFWIRLHPQVVRGYYATSLQPYRDMAGPDVFVEEPPVQSEKLPWDLPATETEHLAQLMAAADVVATPGSTLMIDAVCAGTPVINILFDGDEAVHPAMSTRRFAKYLHQEKILTTGGIAKAWDIDEFVRLVDAFIRDPELDADKRAALIRQQMHRLDGQAGVRTANELWQLAEK